MYRERDNACQYRHTITFHSIAFHPQDQVWFWDRQFHMNVTLPFQLWSTPKISFLVPMLSNGPSTTIAFLGTELNTELLLIRIHEDKLKHLVSTLNDWTKKRACTQKQMLSLIGQLSHVCKAIPVGQTFFWRMIVPSCKPCKMWHWVYLNAEFPSDLLWW